MTGSRDFSTGAVISAQCALGFDTKFNQSDSQHQERSEGRPLFEVLPPPCKLLAFVRIHKGRTDKGWRVWYFVSAPPQIRTAQLDPAAGRCTRHDTRLKWRRQTKVYRFSVSMAKGGSLGSVQSNDFAESALSIGLMREPETNVFNGELRPLDFVGDIACAYIRHNRSTFVSVCWP